MSSVDKRYVVLDIVSLYVKIEIRRVAVTFSTVTGLT
jgi:hypothetical protein